MIFGLKTYRRDKNFGLTPSLYADGTECSRRLWFRASGIAADDENSHTLKTEYLKSQISDHWKDKWRFNIYLPGRIHVDIWIPEEAVFADFKQHRPKTTDLIQCWLKIEELKNFGLNFTEYQLWYPAEEEEYAKKIALMYQLDHETNLCGFYAIAIESPDQDFLIQSGRNRSLMLSEIEKPNPPQKKQAGSTACKGCSFLEFCHM